MRLIPTITAVVLSLASTSVAGESICFSPIKERSGDISSKRLPSQPFDYKIQVDSGPIVVPFETNSTAYEYSSKEPTVKVYLNDQRVESFRISRKMLSEGRNCVYFDNLYETWSVVEKWQADRLCTCQL